MDLNIYVKICFALTMTFVGGSQHNEIRFNDEQIKEILNYHNILRRSISNAANMRELTWNASVALAALEWGLRCEYISSPDNQWGQNMNYVYGKDYNKSSSQLFRDSFNAWSNDTVHDDYRLHEYCGRKNTCSFVQLIAADVQQVGCAIVKCPKLEMPIPPNVLRHSKFLVCFYSPWVNILGTDVYIQDKTCAACPSGTTCVDNLCSARFHLSRVRPFPSAASSNVKIPSLSGIRVTAISDVSHPSQAVQTIDVGLTDYIVQRQGGYSDNNSIGTAHPNREHAETIVVYTPNNRVIPFPGKSERRDIRRIKKYERLEENDLLKKEEKVVHTLELVASNISMADLSIVASGNRKKRQISYDVNLRRQEYERIVRELEIIRRDREERRRRNEEDLRRRELQQLQELRHAEAQNRYNEEYERRQRQLRLDRRQYEALALTTNEGDLTGNEQFFTISAHNVIRRETGANDLAWSSDLERWAKYVIRCEIEYPGPITCYTNFGKAEQDQEIYNVVYQWRVEGTEVNAPLRYGCRTPADRSMCNHYTILQNRSLTQMACAAKNCGRQRQLTCIYSSG